MKKSTIFMAGAALVVLGALARFPVRQAHGQVDTSQVAAITTDFVAPVVFQGAGPSAAAIQGVIEEYRVAIGKQDNGSSGPSGGGHREINWDGRDVITTGPVFDAFLVTRGALFTTPDGVAFTQATPAGLAVRFNNPSYETIFAPLSNPRLFSAIGGKVTEVDFFEPGGGNKPATTNGFGAVFADVDQPDGSGPAEKRGNRHSSTLIEYFGNEGELLFSGFVPASPGSRGLSFLGIVFPDARIAHVRITSGNVAPGPDDDGKHDVVMMDDFLYGEPQKLP